MLIRLNNKTVEGDGYRIIVPDIHTVIYEECARTARLEIEGGMSARVVDWLIYSETLSGWHDESGVVPISATERAIILSRVAESLNLLEMPNRLV